MKINSSKTKFCSGCNEEKTLDCFWNRKTNKTDGKRSRCKNCEKKEKRKWEKINPEKKKKYSKESYQRRKGKSVPGVRSEKEIFRKKKYMKEWRKKNALRIKNYKREYEQQRRDASGAYKLLVNLRKRISKIIQRQQRAGLAISDLGCSFECFREFLEKQFYPHPETKEPMMWKNYGERWEVDHIKPLFLFDLANREQFLEACHYTNLQPLWKEDHEQKTAKDIGGLLGSLKKNKIIINSNKLRKTVLDMVYNAQTGHIGGSFSIAELISVLFEDYDIGQGKDKLILSKAHNVPILYAVFNELGKISDEELKTFRQIDSRLQGHCDKSRLPLLDFTGGSLGQGLSVAVGHALGKKLKGDDGMVFCVVGDGELNECSIWEALTYYPTLEMNNLVCIVDWNKAQNEGYCKDVLNIQSNLREKISSFGWDCRIISGHDKRFIRAHLNWIHKKPLCLILDTVKGKGVSFMEKPAWHSKIPTKDEYERAVKELGF